MRSTRVLVLGGTSEGRSVAAALVADGADVVSSLAGRVTRPRLPEGRVRLGGFGGVEGLAEFLRREHVDALVDATHPFAAQMSEHAFAASTRTGVPMLGVRRPGWVEGPGDRWVRVPAPAEAAGVLRSVGSRCLLTIGRQGVDAFVHVEGVWFLVRAIDPPSQMPSSAELLLTRGPFTVDGELELMRAHGIDVVVTKDSGGSMTEAKLEAAGRLGVPVVVIERPPYPPVPTVTDPAGVVAWVREVARR